MNESFVKRVNKESELSQTPLVGAYHDDFQDDSDHVQKSVRIIGHVVLQNCFIKLLRQLTIRYNSLIHCHVFTVGYQYFGVSYQLSFGMICLQKYGKPFETYLDFNI